MLRKRMGDIVAQRGFLSIKKFKKEKTNYH